MAEEGKFEVQSGVLPVLGIIPVQLVPGSTGTEGIKYSIVQAYFNACFNDCAVGLQHHLTSLVTSLPSDGLTGSYKSIN